MNQIVGPGVGGDFLASILAKIKAQKALAEAAVTQVSDDALRRALDPETNSIAVIMKHMAGNMISRWTDFLTSDGEKWDRNRDQEFVDDFSDRKQIMDYWERGWNCLFAALGALSAEDLAARIRIRGQSLSVVDAIVRGVEHTGYHTGQIVLLARHWAGDDWKTLSIARGDSEAYNKRVWQGNRS
ncbi:MAG: DUF1572 family protein [Planctomycetota bacterium]|jgi:uncharacterized damage-inducible protein DinB